MTDHEKFVFCVCKCWWRESLRQWLVLGGNRTERQNRIGLSWLTCDDGGIYVTMSRCHVSQVTAVLPSRVVTEWATQTKNDPISPDKTTRNCPNCKHFSSSQIISHFEMEKLVCPLSLKKRMQTRLLWFMKIQCGSVENYIWFTAWDGIPALVDVRSNYKPPFWPRLDFYHRWVYICPHLKCTFPPGVGWKVSDLTGLSGLEA